VIRTILTQDGTDLEKSPYPLTAKLIFEVAESDAEVAADQQEN
jgi:hypothetical protein